VRLAFDPLVLEQMYLFSPPPQSRRSTAFYVCAFAHRWRDLLLQTNTTKMTCLQLGAAVSLRQNHSTNFYPLSVTTGELLSIIEIRVNP
jgi:hypothetical protein